MCLLKTYHRRTFRNDAGAPPEQALPPVCRSPPHPSSGAAGRLGPSLASADTRGGAKGHSREHGVPSKDCAQGKAGSHPDFPCGRGQGASQVHPFPPGDGDATQGVSSTPRAAVTVRPAAGRQPRPGSCPGCPPLSGRQAGGLPARPELGASVRAGGRGLLVKRPVCPHPRSVFRNGGWEGFA